MDWITTSGRTLDEAKSNALDQLGIVADEAEFDVVNDVEKGLFGRVKTEAKVRARVRPRQPAPKEERRSRSNGGKSRSRQRKGGGNGGNGGGGQQNRNKQGNKQNNGGKGRNANANSGGGSNEAKANAGGNQDRAKNKNTRNGGNSRQNNNQRGQQGNKEMATAAVAAEGTTGKKNNVEATISREDQEKIATNFLEGVLTSFEMTGSVAVVEEAADDDAIEMTVSGEELGLLVGQKGATLSALQELTRTVVQRNAEGAKTDRLRVDVAGYRARRTAALREFAQKLAQEVADTGTEKLLEPMGAADRKVVHDAITEVDGVETGSEGEEPRRRVVIRPTS